MRRKAFISAGLLALLAPTRALARQPGDGYKTIPYEPEDTRGYFIPGPELIRNRRWLDPEIRATVFRINESGWVWTAESCQGGHPWSKAPMLRLVCRDADAGAMLSLLVHEANIGQGTGRTNLNLTRRGRTPRGWFEVRAYAYHPRGTRQQGLALFGRFAEAVNR